VRLQSEKEQLQVTLASRSAAFRRQRQLRSAEVAAALPEGTALGGTGERPSQGSLAPEAHVA
jgi:hypothetical protein